MQSVLEAWEEPIGLATEGLLALAFLFGAVALLWAGRRLGMKNRAGWRPMMIGLALLAAMATLDFFDEFDDGLWVLAGLDTEPFLEDLILPVVGVGLLVLGILRWVPLHGKLAAAETALHDAEVKQLEAANEFKTQLLNTASHELNTPISAIRLQTHLLRQDLEGLVTDAHMRDLATLDRNVERLGHLVHQTLDVGRIESGNLHLEVDTVDLKTMVQDVVRNLAPVLAGRRVHAPNGTDAPVRIAADSDRLTQVVYNLITNAAKFTPEGGQIRIRCSGEPDAVRLTVEDSGIGMNADQMNRLFQPFERVHDVAETKATGSGLGLFISRGIVEAHGGRIWADSEGPGRGSRFHVELPTEAVTWDGFRMAAQAPSP